MKLFITFLLVFTFGSIASQYNRYGNAVNLSSQPQCGYGVDCYVLTANTSNQSGSAWSSNTFDLRKKIDGYICIYLGNANTMTTCSLDTEDDGADGMVLAFKSLSAANTGTIGGSLGYGGISPSVGIEFDTYPNGANLGDSISQDHTALVVNGVVTNSLKGPIPLMPGGANAEDGNYHIARIIWEPSTFTLSLYFDGVLKFSHVQDFVSTVFSNNPMVQFGAVASTGGCFNTHQVCFPVLQINLEDVSFCEDDSVRVVFNYPIPDTYLWLNSIGDTIVYWDTTFSTPFSDSSFYTSDTGEYILQITSGAVHLTDTLNVYKNSLPVFSLGSDTLVCRDSSLVLDPGIWQSYLWNDSSTSPTLTSFNSGVHWVEIEDTNGCRNRDTIIIQKQISSIEFSGDSLFGCVPLEVNFTDLSTINTGSITGYFWDFGNGNTSTLQNPNSTFTTIGKYSINLKVTTDIGCVFDTSKNNYVEVFPYAVAGFSTIPLVGKELNPINFTNTSTNSTEWQWDFGDATNSTDQNPIKTYTSSDRYVVVLIAANQGGCNDTTQKIVDVIKSQVFFSPNSFTPNNDGLNDFWNVYGVEFATDFNLTVFNRWGELIFETNDKFEKWDGKHEGEYLAGGIYTYHVLVQFEQEGIFEKFGHINLIR